MHIEPGILSGAKIAAANLTAIGLAAAQAPQLLKQPQLVLRTLLAALFFSVFMQSFHLPAGASELHFIGAMPIYLTLGFVPTLLGFGLGLLLQGVIFEPADLLHLGVNFLSLAVPLLALHLGLGRRLAAGAATEIRSVLKLDAAYYAGVAIMVGFWLSMGEVATPFAEWMTFAAAYLPVVLIEPVLTVAVVRLLQSQAHRPLVQLCFAVPASR
ncbi:energy-coupling factor ABC transporter permease [Thauera humireducens]|uniref:Cobalamin biosynthesis protein CbiM n=1 Tax=Thauera humireducens TaxID=1134435 RepID=A0A127K7R9_9RHOO|nr:energy-coupling factor ABC transporter permease [Thauera humireducens]AMO37997.1 cobalamin biosynthesis protein CbiM [Thauera humireducens]